MRAEDLEALQEHILAVVSAKAFALGKSAFDERVMTAIRGMSLCRTNFNSTRKAIFHYFQSASQRPSRSHLSSP
jgi:hypothetical protein